MGEPSHPHFYDLGIFERVPGSQNQLVLSLETPGDLTKSRQFPGTILKYYFDISKRRTPEKGEDPLNASWKSWRWDQYFPESMR